MPKNSLFKSISKFRTCKNIDHSKSITRYYSSTSTLAQSEPQQLRVEQISIPMPWGSVRGQIFGNPSLSNAKPMLCLHGYLDNSNSFKPMAPYMTQTNQYYLIALDLPGHGHSSKLPNGIPYLQKLMLNTVRRCVRHLKLNDFYFLCHSYGVYMSLFYQTVFRNEVIASIGIDWVAPERRKVIHIHELIPKSMDRFIHEDEVELTHQHQSQHKTRKRELTKETALQILLKANNNLDEAAANTLLERGLIVGEDGKLSFSRDRRAKASLASADSISEFVLMSSFIIHGQTRPHLFIHSTPFAYGDSKGVDTVKFVDEIRGESKVHVESVFISGTHHLHMMKPKETANACLDFLLKQKPTLHK